MDSAEFCRLHEVSQINMVAKGEVMPGIMMDPDASVERCCFWCGTPTDILMFASLNKKQREMLRQNMVTDENDVAKIVIGHDPCNSCSEMMGRGICLMEAYRENEETLPTGRYWVFTEKAIRSLVKVPGLADSIVSKKRALIEMDTAKRIGLYDCGTMSRGKVN